jgi:hypothetical protein
MLPIFLSFSNKIKVSTLWLATGNDITKEEVERAIKEQKDDLLLQADMKNTQEIAVDEFENLNSHQETSQELEDKIE